MPTIKVNNANLFYTEKGSGDETLFFSTGYTFDNTMYQAQLDILSQNFRCICYDHRGHGKSEVTRVINPFLKTNPEKKKWKNGKNTLSAMIERLWYPLGKPFLEEITS